MAERSGCGLSRPPGFTREGWSLRAARPLTISHHAVLGPARPPTAEELTELPGDCSITELQTPAATLGWPSPPVTFRGLSRACTASLQTHQLRGSCGAISIR